MGRLIGLVGSGSSALVPAPARRRQDPPAPETIAEISCPPLIGIERCAPSQPERIRRPPWVSAALEHAALLISDDGADRAGEPRPVRPPSDLVAEATERLASCLVDPALH